MRTRCTHRSSVRSISTRSPYIRISRRRCESGNVREGEHQFRVVASLVARDKPAQELIFIKSQLGLGQALTDEGHAAEALGILEKGVAMAADKFGADHTTTADARIGLGTCLLALRQYDKAEPILRSAYTTLE